MTSTNLSTFFLEPSALGDMLYRHPGTLMRRMREKPSSLPPYFMVGRKRLSFRQLTLDWLSGGLDNPNEQIKIHIDGLPRTLCIPEFASLLHFSCASIYTMRSRPSSTHLPPCKDDVWATRSVFDWILPQVQGVDPCRLVVASPKIVAVRTADLLLYGPKTQSHPGVGRGR